MTQKFKRELPNGYVVRLPTEAEWEYAYRANAAPGTPYGEPKLGNEEASKIGIGPWTKYRLLSAKGVPCDRAKMHWLPGTVGGQRQANAWGIYDMCGNLEECTFDLLPRLLPDGNERKRGQTLSKMAYRDSSDPLMWSTDDHAFSLVRTGLGGTKSAIELTQVVPCIGFRPVIGPDLLKERGIAPPKPLSFDLGGGVTMEMVGCPAGTFMMGYGKEASGDHKPFNKPHKVTITRPFWIAKYPLTPHMIEALGICPEVSEHVKQEQKRIWDGIGLRVPYNPLARAPMPAFVQARIFRHLNEKIKNRPQGYIFRCPTSAEWEYACRANGDPEREVYARPKMWGVGLNERAQIGVLPSEKREMLERKGVPIDAQRWKGAYWQVAASVATKKPNAWGLYDMLGNQAEIVLDTFSSQVMRDIEQGFCVVKSPDDLPWIDKDVDPLFWNDGDDAAFLRIDSLNVHGWGENAIWFMKQNARLGYCDGFCLVAGPDLVKERRSGKSGGTVVGGMRSVSIFPRADTKDNKWKKRAPGGFG